MNKYVTPELKEISFIAQEAINAEGEGALKGSNIYNDNFFTFWD